MRLLNGWQCRMQIGRLPYRAARRPLRLAVFCHARVLQVRLSVAGDRLTVANSAT